MKKQNIVILTLVLIAVFGLFSLWQYSIYQKLSKTDMSCGGDWSYNVGCPFGSYCQSLGQGPSAGGLCKPSLSPMFDVFDKSKTTEKIISPNTSPNTEEEEIKSLVTRFEKYIQDRNVQGLVSLFTPSETKDEIASYRNLMGQDPDVGSPRLFNNVTSNFIITNWKISRREYPDNKELITKDNNKYFVIVEETRKNWCNADPCAGTYSFENTGLYVFEIVNSNSNWMVDRYYLMNQNNSRNGGPKYEALNF